MASPKEIKLKVIPAKIANDFVVKHHYSKSYVQNSSLHFGAFLGNNLHGVLSYGSSMVKSKTINLVDTGENNHQAWNKFLELNRMAFDDVLPKNSESRCIAISIKLIKKNAPHIKWIISYSDATACGDGTIYRASGFFLTAIKKNKSILALPDGERISKLGIEAHLSVRKRICKKLGIDMYSKPTVAPMLKAGAKWAEGYQLRYIYLIDKSAKITCPILPYSKIEELNVGMYKGEKRSQLGYNKKMRVLGREALTPSQGKEVRTLPTRSNRSKTKKITHEF